MFTFAALCAVTGIVLGFRFRVTVLIPTNAIIVAAIAALYILQRSAPSAALIEAVIAIIAVELGYICGATARLLLFPRYDSAGPCSATGKDEREVEREKANQD
jgi:hypothetical protein